MWRARLCLRGVDSSNQINSSDARCTLVGHSVIRQRPRAYWSCGEQKNAKICLPLGITTNSDFVFTRPRPTAEVHAASHKQWAISLTIAACGGLRLAPDCRPRRTYLHLSYSCASPFGPAILVTHDPEPTLNASLGVSATASLQLRICSGGFR
jgi:hypothetical protein